MLLRAKFSFLLCVALLAAAGVAVAWFVGAERERQVDALVERADVLGRLMQERVGSVLGGSGDPQDLQGLVQHLGRLPEVNWVEVFDADSRVIAHSEPERLGEAPLAPHKVLIAQILATGQETQVRELDEGLFLQFVPVFVGDRLAGVVELNIDTAPTLRQVALARRNTLGVACLALVAAWLTLYLALSGIVLKPLRRMVAATRRVAKGDLYTSLQFGRRDEIGQLADAFDTMVSGLRATTTSREELRKSEAQLRAIYENTPDHIMTLDREGRIRLINRTVPDLTREQVIGTPAEQYVPEDQRRTMRECFERVYATGRQDGYQVRYEDSEGNVSFFEARVAPIRDGDTISGLTVSSTDITERLRAQRELRESEEHLQLALRAAAVGTWIWRPEDGTVVTDDHLPPLFGLERLPDSLDEFLALIHPEDRDELAELFNRALESDERRIDFRVSWPNGECHHLTARGRVSRDERGKPTHVAGVCGDIGERKRVESELIASRERLRGLAARIQEAREEERTTIAREIHDELGQALTALKMDLSWFADRVVSEPHETRERARSMIAILDRTLTSVREISYRLRPAVLDDLGLEAAVEAMAREFTRRSDCAHTLDLAADSLAADRERDTAVFRILQEALTNVARHAKAREVHISLRKQDARLIVRVEDDGTGIAEDETDGVRSLGLVGMRERAACVGGSVSIARGAARGTVVELTVPLEDEQHAAP